MKKIPVYLFLFCFVIANAQNKTTDDLLVLLKTAKEDTNKVNLLYELSDLCEEKDILKYAEPSLKLAQKLGYKKGIANALNNIGFYYEHSEYDIGKALENYTEAIRIHEEIGNDPGLAVSLSNMGLIYKNSGFLEKATAYFMRGLHVREKINDKAGISRSLNHLGRLYEQQGFQKEALDVLQRALKIEEEIDNEGMLSTLTNLSDILYQSGKYTEAKKQYTKALNWSRKLNDKKYIASSLHALGVIALKTGGLDSALNYFHASEKVSKEINDKRALASCMISIGTVYGKKQNIEKGLEYNERAIDLGKSLGNVKILQDAYDNLSYFYSSQKNFKKAFQTHVLFKQMSDSLNNIEIHNGILRKHMQYDFELKEKEIKSEQEKKDAKAKEEKRILNIIIAGLFFLFASIFAIVYLFFRQNKLKAEQQTIQLEQKLLRSQMNPHFIFNCLQAIQNFTLKNNGKEATRYLSVFGSLTRSVLQNSRVEHISLQNEITLMEQYLELQKLLTGNRFEYKINISPGVDILNTSIPPMLAQPFIENAIEHGMRNMQQGGKIDIVLKEENDNLLLEITDNGTGIKQEYTGKHHSLATTITKERIELLNKKNKQKISFSISEAYPLNENKGVKVSFTIPLT